MKNSGMKSEQFGNTGSFELKIKLFWKLVTVALGDGCTVGAFRKMFNLGLCLKPLGLL